MPPPQHESERDQAARRNQHPIRPADIGDGAEEIARFRRERLGPLQKERVEDIDPEQDEGHRQHQLLKDGQLSQAKVHRQRHMTLAGLGARLPSQMK